MKRALAVLILVGLIVAAFYIGSSVPKKESLENVQMQRAISELGARYNAVTDWEERVLTRMPLYTVELEETLVRTDNRPVLFLGRAEDISRQAGKYFVHFDSGFYPLIRLVLECNPDQVREIRKQDRRLDEFAVVAEIESVDRLKFGVSAYPLSGSETEVEIDFPETFVARGRCMDLLFVGDYRPRTK